MSTPTLQASPTAGDRPPSRPYRCSWNDPEKGLCQGTFKSLNMLQRHTYEVHERRYEKQCPDCGCWLNNKGSLGRHRGRNTCKKQQNLRAERHRLGQDDPPDFRRRLYAGPTSRNISAIPAAGTGSGLDLRPIQPVPQSSSGNAFGGSQLPLSGTNMGPPPFPMPPAQTAPFGGSNMLGPFQPSSIPHHLTMGTQNDITSWGGLAGQNLGSNISASNKLLETTPALYNPAYLHAVTPSQTAPFFQTATSLQNAPLQTTSFDQNASQFQPPVIQQAQPYSADTNTKKPKKPRKGSSRSPPVPFPDYDQEKYEMVPIYEGQTRIGSKLKPKRKRSLDESRVSANNLGSHLVDAGPGPGPNDCMHHYPAPCPSTCNHFHTFIDPAILEVEAQAGSEVEDEDAEDY